MSFKLKDPDEQKPDKEKKIVEENVQSVTTGEFTLDDLEKSLERWKELARQTKENIPLIEDRIKEVKKLFT